MGVVLGVGSFFVVLALTFIWAILAESFALNVILVGFAVSVVCVLCFYRFFKLERIKNVNLIRFFIYLFYLVGQIYLAGFNAIMLLIKGAKAAIVTVTTDTDDDFFAVMLANSITLTPGTLSLELADNEISVLWLRDKDGDLDELSNADEIIKGKLERQLLKAQK